MPRRPNTEKLMPLEQNEKIRYSSVTLPRDFCFFLDKLIFFAGKKEISKLPSRRMIVQDALEFYIEQICPEFLKEYQQMLRDTNMHYPLEIRLQYKRDRKETS